MFVGDTGRLMQALLIKGHQMVGFRYEGMGTSIFMVEIKWTKWFRWPAYRNLVLVHDVFERSSGLPDGVELAQSVTMESLPGQ